MKRPESEKNFDELSPSESNAYLNDIINIMKNME